MAIALALLADPAYARVRLTVTGAVGTEVTLSRLNADNELVAIRNADPLVPVGGTAEVYDYEAPLNTLVTYRADDSAGTFVTATVTLTVTQAWLKNPFAPSQNQIIKLKEYPSLSRTRPQGIHGVLNRKMPIVTYGTLSSKSGSMILLTGNEAASDFMATFLDSTGLGFLQIPYSRFSEMYLALGNVGEAPLTFLQLEDAMYWTIDIIEIDRPDGDLVGNPTATYDSLRDLTIPTYTALKTTKTNYLAVMRGVGVPTVPPNPGSF